MVNDALNNTVRLFHNLILLKTMGVLCCVVFFVGNCGFTREIIFVPFLKSLLDLATSSFFKNNGGVMLCVERSMDSRGKSLV